MLVLSPLVASTATTKPATARPAAGNQAATASAAKPAPPVTPFKDATFLLPKGVKITPRWVLPPSGKGSTGAMFSVDQGGTPFLVSDNIYTWGESYLVNPKGNYLVALNAPISAMAHVSGDVLLLASGSDLVFPAAPKEKVFDKNNVPVAALQPLTKVPLLKIADLSGVGTTVYCAGPDLKSSRHAVYVLRAVKGAGIKDLELVYESPEPITAVAGDEDAVYAAAGQAVSRISLKDGLKVPYYTHPSDPVKQLVKTAAGLLVSTGSEVVLAGDSGSMEIMRSSGHRIAVSGDSLYVLFHTSLGIAALDGISDLKRFNLGVRPVAPGETPAPLPVEAVRFYETDNPDLPGPYGDTFDRANIRRIAARIDFAPAARIKKEYSVTVSWFEPTGGQLRSTTYRAGRNTDNIVSVIGGEKEGYLHPRQLNKGGIIYRFGKDALGMRYPGVYRLIVQVDGVPAGEWSFTVTGKASPWEAILYDDVATMTTFLNEGLSARHKSDKGVPLLIEAIQFGSARMVKLLLDRGADANGADAEGHPPLERCEYAGEWREKAEALVSHWANVNALRYPDGPPLIASFNTEVKKFLLQKGASVSYERSGLGRQTVLEELSDDACTDDMVSLIMQRGGDLNDVSTSYMNLTPLGRAIFHGRERCVEIFLKKGASPEIVQREPNRPPRSALYLALTTLNERKEEKDKALMRNVIRLLVQKGATLRPGKKVATSVIFDIPSEDYSRWSEEYRSITAGEGRAMFSGDNPSFFDRLELIKVLDQDDGALDEATDSKDPAIRELALTTHINRVREVAAKAKHESDLQYTAHKHCEKAFKLSEAGYRLGQVDMVPDGPASPQGKPQLGLTLLKRPTGGAYVQSVAPGGPGERAGLKGGDIILALDTQKVKDLDELLAATARLTPGMPVRITFMRDEPMRIPNLQLTCGLLESEVRDLLGFAEMNLTRWLAAKADDAAADAVRERLRKSGQRR